ncbi:MAG: hypothetical protein ACKVZJ_01830 [Phycisphaerales bacterium]
MATPQTPSSGAGPIDTRKQPQLPPGTPYCSNCLYDLSASTETGRCPECGRPLIEILARVSATVLPSGMRARRYRSTATVFGMPFLDIATGPRPDAGEMYGHARGFIAIGDVATGVIALGGRATGIVSAGGLSVGLFSVGGMSVGGLLSAGGLAVAIPGIAAGGMGVGGIGTGGMGIGVVAQGGMAVGVYAKGGGAFGLHTISRGNIDPAAATVFNALSFLWPPGMPMMLAAYMPMLIVFASVVGIGLLLFAFAQVFKKEPVFSN